MIKKILVTDDSPVARKMLISSIPKDRGYEITQAVDGQDGINKYLECSPDLVFMDLTMPVKDGYQALDEIKKLNNKAIIVIVTADVQQQSISRVMELGAFTLIRKPSTPAVIADVIEKATRFLEQSGGERI